MFWTQYIFVSRVHKLKSWSIFPVLFNPKEPCPYTARPLYSVNQNTINGYKKEICYTNALLVQTKKIMYSQPLLIQNKYKDISRSSWGYTNFTGEGEGGRRGEERLETRRKNVETLRPISESVYTVHIPDQQNLWRIIFLSVCFALKQLLINFYMHLKVLFILFQIFFVGVHSYLHSFFFIYWFYLLLFSKRYYESSKNYWKVNHKWKSWNTWKHAV